MMKNWSYDECGQCGKLIHNVVDKLRGIDLALRTLLHPLSVSVKDAKIRLSTFTVDNLVGKCSEAEYQPAILFPSALASSASFCFRGLLLPGAVRHLYTALSARATHLPDGDHLAAPPDSPLYDPHNYLTWE